jgi:hypothetical protein
LSQYGQKTISERLISKENTAPGLDQIPVWKRYINNISLILNLWKPARSWNHLFIPSTLTLPKHMIEFNIDHSIEAILNHLHFPMNLKKTIIQTAKLLSKQLTVLQTKLI